jgi:nucleotide-binding universal stress UspA family protein
MLSIKHILVPIDWSEQSQRAFRLAAVLARENNARLTLLHVIPLAAVMYGPPTECYVNHMLEELHCLARGDPTTRVQCAVVEGSPGSEILSTARETSCDLIVMGTHGRTGLNRLMMGSVADEVLRQASCPVLVVNNQFPADLPSQEKAVEQLLEKNCK